MMAEVRAAAREIAEEATVLQMEEKKYKANKH
jgi:hypothetical protein